LSLENANIAHNDNMITKLFIPSQDSLSGTFHPGGKPWTRALIQAD
jgi:hypothetical protein